MVAGNGEPTDEIGDSARSLWESTLNAIPRLGVAIAIVFVGWLLGRGARLVMRARLSRHRTHSFAKVMSKVTSWIVVIASVLLALAVTLPSVQPIDLLAGLGFFSVAVAVGFAFQDILENNPRRCTERSIDAVVADLPIGFASTAKSVRTLLGAIAGVKIS